MQYYIESDGKLFLIPRKGILDLPCEKEIPFPIDRIAPLATNHSVIFCVPRLEVHPHEWIGKDEIPALSSVSPVVREAVHAAMPRMVEGISLKDGSVLLVKGSRGLTKERWSLPGGFLRFGETPQQGLVREMKEELGVEARIQELLGIKAKLAHPSRLHWIMVFYRIVLTGEVHPNPDEIAKSAILSASCGQRAVVRLTYAGSHRLPSLRACPKVTEDPCSSEA